MSVAFRVYREPRLPRPWNFAIVVLTVASLVVVYADSQLSLTSSQAGLLDLIDLAFCAFFLTDYFWRLALADDRKAFVNRNWIDLLSSLPLTGPLRAGRVLRLLRLLRLVRTNAFQSFLAERYGIYVSSAVLNGVVGIAALVWVTTGSLFYAFEHANNPEVHGLGDAMWWSITTLSTVGYGDLYPLSLGGRAVAVVTMVLGVGVVGTLAATVATAFIDMRDRGKRGLRRYSMEGHLIVLGWNDKAQGALEEFRADQRYSNTPVVIVADFEENPSTLADVRFVRGVPGQREALERASAAEAAAAIVFASDPNDPRSDHETALTILAFRRLNTKATISAELVDGRNREHVIEAGCDSVVLGSELASALLIRSVQDTGVSEVISELLSAKRGAELYRAPIDPALVGGTYGQVVRAMAERSQPVLGLARNHDVMVYPGDEIIIEAGDELFLVGRPTHD